MTFRPIRTHAVTYWCPTGPHQSLVSVSRSRNPWDRVFCYDHREWMHTATPVTPAIQPALQPSWHS